MPEVEVHFTEIDERIYVAILDNGPGIPAPVGRTLLGPRPQENPTEQAWGSPWLVE
jgi:C4-dicarboxylate-specific signal transduction histidine kinase